MAHESTTKPQQQMILPILVTGMIDVGRLARELEQIDNQILQLNLRKGGEEVKMPKTSRLMDQMIQDNHLNLLQDADRVKLKAFLGTVKQHSPIIHMSFSSDPSTAFTEKLMAWLRREIHPLLLLTIGLEPNIGAGSIVRTANKQFDFSLRQDFKDKRELLLSKLAAPAVAIPVAVVAKDEATVLPEAAK